MQSFLLGSVVVLIGGVIGYYSHYLVEMFGNIERADRNLGGTRQGYVLGSFVIMIIGFSMMFGLIDLTQDQQIAPIQGPSDTSSQQSVVP